MSVRPHLSTKPVASGGKARIMKVYTRGTEVKFRDANDEVATGKVIGYGQADDGTGRYGWWIRAECGDIYWRQRVSRVAGVDTHS